LSVDNDHIAHKNTAKCSENSRGKMENQISTSSMLYNKKSEQIRPVIEGRVALFPRTFKWRLDFSSPPSTTTHLTRSFVFDFTANDIIPPMSQKITLPSLVSRRETYECSEYLVERSLCEYRQEKENKTKEDDY
jgi:hypothetical protein